MLKELSKKRKLAFLDFIIERYKKMLELPISKLSDFANDFAICIIFADNWLKTTERQWSAVEYKSLSLLLVKFPELGKKIASELKLQEKKGKHETLYLKWSGGRRVQIENRLTIILKMRDKISR